MYREKRKRINDTFFFQLLIAWNVDISDCVVWHHTSRQSTRHAATLFFSSRVTYRPGSVSRLPKPSKNHSLIDQSAIAWLTLTKHVTWYGVLATAIGQVKTVQWFIWRFIDFLVVFYCSLNGDTTSKYRIKKKLKHGFSFSRGLLAP